MRLREAFAAQKLDVYTHAEEIEQVTALARALNLIFALICAATAIGFLASTASSVFMASSARSAYLACCDQCVYHRQAAAVLSGSRC